MLSLLEFREKIKEIYGKNNIFIIPFIKFALVYISLIVFSLNISYSHILSDPIVLVLLALICSLLPFSLISLVLALYITVGLYFLSVELAILFLVVCLITSFFYYIFKADNIHLLILIPLLFFFKVPYLVPLVLGISSTLISIVPLIFSVIIYYILNYIKNNVGVLTNDISTSFGQRYYQVLNSIFSNKLMYLIILTFIITLIIVYIIHNLPINHSFTISLLAGVFSLFIIILFGEIILKLKINLFTFSISLLVSFLLAYVYKFFIYDVDYTRTEYINFEDDDYFYYVKAVPKINIKVSDIRVENINTIKKENDKKQEDKLEN